MYLFSGTVQVNKHHLRFKRVRSYAKAIFHLLSQNNVHWNINKQRFTWKEMQCRERGSVYLQMASRLWDFDSLLLPPPESSWFHLRGAKRWPHHFYMFFLSVHILCLRRKNNTWKKWSQVQKLHELVTLFTSCNVLTINCFVFCFPNYLSQMMCTFAEHYFLFCTTCVVLPQN